LAHLEERFGDDLPAPVLADVCNQASGNCGSLQRIDRLLHIKLVGRVVARAQQRPSNTLIAGTGAECLIALFGAPPVEPGEGEPRA